MRTSSHEFLPMTISTRSANSCAGINPRCAVFFDSLPAQILPWRTISHRKPLFALTRIFAAFAVKRDFQHGFTESRTTVFARMRVVARNSSVWMRSSGKGSRIRRLSILQGEQDPQTVDPGLRHDLMHALNLLPLHERTAVVLCCQNGLSHDEAARVLDIPLGTVKTNVLRGREKLKRTLAAWGPN